MDLAAELKRIVKGEVVDDEATLTKYSTDASIFRIKPRVVVFPLDVEDIKEVVKFVALRKKDDPTLSITVRSGGTDMSGGALTESIVLDVNKYLNRMKEVAEDPVGGGEAGYAVVEPGMYYRDFEKETLKKGLIMPSYPASREICTVGGMVANNAGGEKTLTYGKTEDYVREVKMILRDGNEYVFKPFEKSELEKKMAVNSVEGEVYNKLFNLIDTNYEILKSAKPKVSKNSAGYFLWNVLNKEKEIFDIPKVIVGSQGTFGVITEITFALVHPKKHSALLIIFIKNIKDLGHVVKKVLEHTPESFESYDDIRAYTYKHVEEPMASKISQLAIRAFRGLHHKDWAKFDVRVDDETGIPYFTDSNPNTAFGPDLGLPMTEVLALHGVSFDELLASLLSKYARQLS